MLVGWCVWVFGLCFVLARCFLAPGEFLPLISFHLLKIPVVEPTTSRTRPAMQEKKFWSRGKRRSLAVPLLTVMFVVNYQKLSQKGKKVEE